MKLWHLVFMLIFINFVNASGKEAFTNPLQQPLVIQVKTDKINTLAQAVYAAENYKNGEIATKNMTHTQVHAVATHIKELRGNIQNAILDFYEESSDAKSQKLADYDRTNTRFDRTSSSIICTDRACLCLTCCFCCFKCKPDFYVGQDLFKALETPIFLGKAEYKIRAGKDLPRINIQSSAPVQAYKVGDDERR